MKKLFAAALLAATCAHAQTTVEFTNPTWTSNTASQGDFVWESDRGIGLMGTNLTGFLQAGVWLRRTDELPFGLISMTVADYMDTGNDQARFDITWYDTQNQPHGLWAGYLDDQPGLQTFTVNLTGITKLVIHGMDESLPAWEYQDSRMAFGPISVNLEAQTVPVPEPAAISLLLAGLGMILLTPGSAGRSARSARC